MFLKRRIILALDKYEDVELAPSHPFAATNKQEEGITQGAFVAWFRDQDKNKIYTYQAVNKCINDCIEDGYINRVYVDAQPYLVPKQNDEGLIIGTKLNYPQMENLSLSSKGRDLKHWYFFYPAIVEKMNAKELALLVIGTSITIVLTYLGFQNL